MKVETSKELVHDQRQRMAVLEWNQRYLEVEKQYISRVDQLIQEGTQDAYEKICEMFEETDEMPEDKIIASGKIPINIFKERTEFAYLIQAINIYCREYNAGVEFTVFDHGNSLLDIIDVMNYVRLLLLEKDFFKSDEVLVQYVNNYKISHWMLSYLAEATVGELSKVKADAPYKQADKDLNRHTGKKIAFILCVNNDVYMNEALYFINRLEVPCGCEVEIFTVQDAKSMTSGYNEGMNASNAKYKVYLHQDVFIVNPYFIYDILDIFENTNVGMVGMVGAPHLKSYSKVMWHSERIGAIYTMDPYGAALSKLGEMSAEYESVEVIDGLLMATQYDIPWREDLFNKWDMYDMSQSMEFHRAGYDVVVPNMDVPWCLHDDGFLNLTNYYEELDKFEGEYYSK